MNTQPVTITVKVHSVAQQPVSTPRCVTVSVKAPQSPVAPAPKREEPTATSVVSVHKEPVTVTSKNVQTTDKPSVLAKVAAPVAPVESKVADNNVPVSIDPAIQEEYDNVQSRYFFPFENAKDELYKAFYDDNVSESSLIILAKRVIALDDALSNFWERYHVAVDEAQGKSVLPEVKERLEAEHKRYEKIVNKSLATPQRALSSYTKAEIDEMIAKRTLPHHVLQLGLCANDIKDERIRRDKAYLIRGNRSEVSDAVLEQIKLAVQELHDWGEKITETMERTCAKYGYTIPSDWVYRPDDPSTKEAKKRIHNEQAKASYAKKSEVSRALRKSKKEELLKSFEGF